MWERILAILSPTPLILWIAAKLYVSKFEGWGAWAAAPILLIPLVFSLVIGFAVSIQFMRLPASERRRPKHIVVVILPWFPILHVMLANLLGG
jgi:hypothetical protein